MMHLEFIHILPPGTDEYPGPLGDLVFCHMGVSGSMDTVFHIYWKEVAQTEAYIAENKFVEKGACKLILCPKCVESPDYALYKLADLP